MRAVMGLAVMVGMGGAAWAQTPAYTPLPDQVPRGSPAPRQESTPTPAPTIAPMPPPPPAPTATTVPPAPHPRR
jgi:hypothetical protein